jgi:hypothetical protein
VPANDDLRPSWKMCLLACACALSRNLGSWDEVSAPSFVLDSTSHKCASTNTMKHSSLICALLKMKCAPQPFAPLPQALGAPSHTSAPLKLLVRPSLLVRPYTSNALHTQATLLKHPWCALTLCSSPNLDLMCPSPPQECAQVFFLSSSLHSTLSSENESLILPYAPL